MHKKQIIIAIDGPAASGKSTTARRLAERLGYIYLDTGAMYRACALAALESRIRPDDISRISTLMDQIKLEIRQGSGGNLLFLNGVDITEAIRTEEISRLASAISAIGVVRQKMTQLQRKLGASGGVVLDGRDIGTVVFPQAELKVFMIADPKERARRRYEELVSKGEQPVFEDVLEELIDRDKNDSSRSLAPLIAADDAIKLDTSNLSLDEQVNAVYKLALEVLKRQ